MNEEEQQARKQYLEQVAKFRAALDKGDVVTARELATEFDWSTDATTDEVMEWFRG